MTMSILPKKRRGRPPKLKSIITAVSEPLKRKRGRPPKNAAINTIAELPLLRKRGRPKKSAIVSVSKKEVVKTKASTENFVTGKMFIHSKRVSKQEPWFDEWYQSYDKAKSNKDWSSLIQLIRQLEDGVNKILSHHQDIKLSIHVPVIKLVQDEEMLQVFFEPIYKGVEISVFYRSKDFPLGLTPSLKATAVCNKLTEIIKSSVPVGVSG